MTEEQQFVFAVVYEIPNARLAPNFQKVEFVQCDWFSCLALKNPGREVLTAYIKTKGYYRPKRKFLVLCRDTGACFTILPVQDAPEKDPALAYRAR